MSRLGWTVLLIGTAVAAAIIAEVLNYYSLPPVVTQTPHHFGGWSSGTEADLIRQNAAVAVDDSRVGASQ